MLVGKQEIHFEGTRGNQSINPSRPRNVERRFQLCHVGIQVHFAVEDKDFLDGFERQMNAAGERTEQNDAGNRSRMVVDPFHGRIAFLKGVDSE